MVANTSLCMTLMKLQYCTYGVRRYPRSNDKNQPYEYIVNYMYCNIESCGEKSLGALKKRNKLYELHFGIVDNYVLYEGFTRATVLVCLSLYFLAFASSLNSVCDCDGHNY